jgi:hypothetical protein
MSFIELDLLLMFYRTGNPASFPGLPVLKCEKSICYPVFADRAAIADGLNPFAISHTARTNSFRPIGILK